MLKKSLELQTTINEKEKVYTEVKNRRRHFSIEHLNDLKECIQCITKKVQEHPEYSFEIYKELYEMLQDEIFSILYFSFLDHQLTLKQYEELLRLYRIEKGSVDVSSRKYMKIVDE